jgi:Arc/MetJ-type ribon-helix-helix transcriptional regulator
MATVKVTVTMTEEQLEAIREIVREGRSSSVSGFVQNAVRVSLSDVAAWDSMLDEAFEEAGGPMTEEERVWAETVLAGGAPEHDPPERKPVDRTGDASSSSPARSSAA